MKTFSALFVLSLALIAPELSYACSCMPRTLQEYLDRAENVAIARVVALEEIPDSTEIPKGIAEKTTLRILKSFKGQATGDLVLEQEQATSCAFSMEFAKAYLVFSRKKSTHPCSGTAYIPVWGPMTKPELPDVGSPGYPTDPETAASLEAVRKTIQELEKLTGR